MFRKLFIAAVIAAAPSIAHADGEITLAGFSPNATIADFSNGTTSSFGYRYTVGTMVFDNDAIGPQGSGFGRNATHLTDNDGSNYLSASLGGTYQRVGFEITGAQDFDIYFSINADPIRVSLSSFETKFVGFESAAGITGFTIVDVAQYQYGFRTTIGNLRLDGAVAPVPEPGEWAMIAVGLAVAGAAARRRSRATA